MIKANINYRDGGDIWVKLFAMMFAVICCGGTAPAAIVGYTVNGTGVGFNTFDITWDKTSALVPAGGFKLSQTSGGNQFFTVCLDIGSTLTLFKNYNYSDATAFAGQSGLNPKWGAGNGEGLVNSGNAAAAIQAAADIFFKHSSVLTGSSLVEQSALQLAVWEALYDTTAGGTTYNLTGGGRFSATAGNQLGVEATDLAAIWLSEVNTTASYSGSLLNPVPESQYGLPVQSVFYNVTPVPEPTTMIAGALLLLPFAASTVRYLRKHPTRKV